MQRKNNIIALFVHGCYVTSILHDSVLKSCIKVHIHICKNSIVLALNDYVAICTPLKPLIIVSSSYSV